MEPTYDQKKELDKWTGSSGVENELQQLKIARSEESCGTGLSTAYRLAFAGLKAILACLVELRAIRHAVTKDERSRDNF